VKLRIRMVRSETAPMPGPGEWSFKLPDQFGNSLWLIVAPTKPGEFEVETP